MFKTNTDLSKPTCRVCLKNVLNEEMSSIFDVDSDVHDLHIYEKIEQCAGIRILRYEEMPTLICRDCYGFLKVSYKFRIICRNSNEYLKKCISLASKGVKAVKSAELNPLSISENTNKIEAQCSQSTKSKLRVKKRPLPETISINQDSPMHSPAHSEELIVLNFDSDDNKYWFDADNKNDENVENDISFDENINISIEKFDLDVKKETEEDADKKKKTITRKKKSNAKTKKPSTKRSKTLTASSDGTTIKNEEKPRVKAKAKRQKKEKLPHICEVCGNTYPHRYSLELHMRRHRNEKPFACEICGDAFHSNFQLIRHMRKHTGSRPYKCSYCPRAFGDQSTLIKHERVHRNERPFKCDTCGKSFSYTGVLNYHKLVHTGEKPYACEICGKCFPRRHNLRAHLETLQHQNDPRTKMLLQNIRKNNEDETLKVQNTTNNI